MTKFQKSEKNWTEPSLKILYHCHFWTITLQYITRYIMSKLFYHVYVLFCRRGLQNYLQDHRLKKTLPNCLKIQWKITKEWLLKNEYQPMWTISSDRFIRWNYNWNSKKKSNIVNSYIKRQMFSAFKLSCGVELKCWQKSWKFETPSFISKWSVIVTFLRYHNESNIARQVQMSGHHFVLYAKPNLEVENTRSQKGECIEIKDSNKHNYIPLS